MKKVLKIVWKVVKFVFTNDKVIDLFSNLLKGDRAKKQEPDEK